jgi:WhiB family transcriptional regulator, redox-sensing transcriptional regulator
MSFLDTEWMREGICSQTDPDAWVSDLTVPTQVAALKKICGSCPVQSECLSYALKENLQYGVWGGTTPSERRAARRRLKAAP